MEEKEGEECPRDPRLFKPPKRCVATWTVITQLRPHPPLNLASLCTITSSPNLPCTGPRSPVLPTGLGCLCRQPQENCMLKNYLKTVIPLTHPSYASPTPIFSCLELTFHHLI